MQVTFLFGHNLYVIRLRIKKSKGFKRLDIQGYSYVTVM